MSIAVECGTCQKRFNARDEHAGKKGKCSRCGSMIRVPTPDVSDAPAMASLLDTPAMASLLDEEGVTAVAYHKCPSCGKRLKVSAVLCVACGYDLRSGNQLETTTDTDTAAASQTESGGASRRLSNLAGGFLFGCVLSLVFALFGAGVWVGVALATGWESGLIAWGVGALAGVGMVVGSRQEDDLSGIAAAFISIFAILAAKWMIFAYVLLPIVNELRILIPDGAGEAAPSNLSLFFQFSFGPIDGLFILLAFFSAYRVGSGASGD